MMTASTAGRGLSATLRDTLPKDLTAGLVVALVALPLCLGVALASKAPLISGLIAGIVGGLLVSWLSGSHTSVSGPAAGLTAVVATQIDTLGSFNAFLSAVMVGGFLQLLLGLARAGSLAGFFPSSVIKGLLAAIGVLLILKQIPHLFGHDPDWVGDMSFSQADGENTFSELLATWFDIHPGASLIGLLSVALLWSWPHTPLKRLPLPAPLAVVLGSVGLNALLSPLGEVWFVGESHLVSVPMSSSFAELFSGLERPAFGALGDPKVWVAGLTLCVVASLETLLNLEAVDKIDPQGRTSPPNRELLAQGAGNMVSGLLGGIPLTSVIVRSSVNISSGGQTRLASFVHGLLLLLAVGLIPSLLNMIPLAALAAILLVTGFKLASPKLMLGMWREGWRQFAPFIITISAIVLTDLLIGVIIGLATAILFILQSNLNSPVSCYEELDGQGEPLLRFELGSHVSFLNRAALHEALSQVKRGSQVVIDARKSRYIDADILDMLSDFEDEDALSRDLKVSLIGFEGEHHKEDKRLFVSAPTKELQAQLSPEQILARLTQGHERFLRGEPAQHEVHAQISETAGAQSPLAVIISCMDSRVSPERIFDVGIGELFVVRVAGNIITPEALGSVEYACAIAGAKLVLVMGHTRCGAVKASVETTANTDLGSCEHLGSLIEPIQRVVSAGPSAPSAEQGAEAHERYLDEVSARNVLMSVREVCEGSADLRAREARGELKVVGALYDVRKGELLWELEGSPKG